MIRKSVYEMNLVLAFFAAAGATAAAETPQRPDTFPTRLQPRTEARREFPAVGALLGVDAGGAGTGVLPCIAEK